MTMNYFERFHLRTFVIILVCMASIAYCKPLPDELPPLNAVSAGMGCAMVAVPFDPSTIYWNPAGIAMGTQLGVDMSIFARQLEAPGSWSFLVVNSSPDGGGRSGLGIIRRSAWRDSLEYKSFQVLAPLAHSFGDGNFPIGFTTKFIAESLEGNPWKYGLAMDFGAIYRLGGSRIGFVSRNFIGSNLRSFRRESWVGAAIGEDNSSIVISGQVTVVKKLSWKRINDNYNVGIRLKFSDEFPDIYLGRIQRATDRWNTLGLGYANPDANVKIGYSYSFDPAEKENQVHTLTYSFGAIARERVRSPGSRW